MRTVVQLVVPLLLSFVLVILFVAAVAVDRRIAVASEVFAAAAALQFCISMRIAKLKLGQVMIKAARSRLPVALAVAIGAGLAKGDVRASRPGVRNRAPRLTCSTLTWAAPGLL